MRQIAETLKQKTSTVQSWKLRNAWDNVAPISLVESSMENRLIQRIMKEVKGNGDYKEIDAPGRQIERLARVECYRSSGVDRMRQAMRDTKGLGNFRNLFMYVPNGKLDGINILPLSEVATKDDLFNIKKVSREDLLSAYCVPPQMMRIISDNSGGFGDAVKAAHVFVCNELTLPQERIKEINYWINEEVITFRA